jgi:UDP-N-acetylglucosamine transferase subunit ALG13
VSNLDILVILGTDHHRFGRLVGWLDTYLEQPGNEWLQALVQLGTTAPPRRAEGVGIIGWTELQQLMREATAVVSHGGPATMLEVRRQGHKPIVVPRDPLLGEHIDQHQQEFSRRMGALGLITLCEEQAAFEAALTAVLRDPAAHQVSPEENLRDSLQVATAVNTAGRIIDDLAARHARRRLAKS